MKILLYTDNHFCENSSLIRNFGTHYSSRLENQIESLNWVEKTAYEHGCVSIMCLGDFFDRPDLNEHEISALKEIKWYNPTKIYHFFLVGNHESSSDDLSNSSTNALSLVDTHMCIVNKPSEVIYGNTRFVFLPYITEGNRKSIKEYLDEASSARLQENGVEENNPKYTVILSHNDLKGIQMGPVVSRTGFELNDIEANCNLFINGHLHNGVQITDKIRTLGDLTGKDFGEDANKYKHVVAILDTETLKVEYIENPYAFNFYKVEVNMANDLKKLSTFKTNANVSVKCKSKFADQAKKLLEENKNVINYRIILTEDEVAQKEKTDYTDLTVDHIQKFIECCRANIADTPILEAELSEICK